MNNQYKHADLDHMQQQLTQRLTLQQITQCSPQQLLHLILQKQEIIGSFSRQITKYKSQSIKSQKLISSLQQKIEKALPSANNTSGDFLMPSEFKSLFTNFMNTTVPAVFYDYLECPKVYAEVLRKLFEAVYAGLQHNIEGRLKEMTQTLLCSTNKKQKSQQLRNSLQEQQQHQQQNHQIFHYILPYLQQHYKQLFPLFKTQNSLSSSQSQPKSISHPVLFTVIFNHHDFPIQLKQKLLQLTSTQNQSSQQIRTFFEQLYEISMYMLLQLQKWEYLWTDQDLKQDKCIKNNSLQASNYTQIKRQKVIYNKKEFNCVDGFVKQGKQVIYLLKGLIRKEQNKNKQYHQHPNIRNFVLPLNQDQNQDIQDNYRYLDFDIKLHFINQTSITPVKVKILKLQDNYTQTITINQTQIIQQQVCSKNTQLPNVLTQSNLNSQNTLKQHLTNRIDLNKQIPKSTIMLSNKNQEKMFKYDILPGQTDKSVIVQSGMDDQQFVFCDQQSKGKINLKQFHYNIGGQMVKKHVHDKENICQNVNIEEIHDKKHLASHSKKDKSLLQKNLMKKSKKQKNSSTIDLTNQKRKLSQKDQIQEIYLVAHKKRNDEFPLSRQIHKCSKRKNSGKSTRKCSVGKIVSQSTQIFAPKLQQNKISMSHHSTLVMKQSIEVKSHKQNNPRAFNQAQHCILVQNNKFLNNMSYQKAIPRPKKSYILTKSQDRHLLLNLNQINGSIQAMNKISNQQISLKQKQQKPMMLRMYQNNCHLENLRQKYLGN